MTSAPQECSADEVPCRTFRILDLPFDILQCVFQQMLLRQIVHLCPDRYRAHHYDPENSTIISRAREYRGCLLEDHALGNFYDDLSVCCSMTFVGLHEHADYSSIQLDRSLPSMSDVVAFMVSCKQIYRSLEPALWAQVTFAIGLPHFTDFADRFLLVPPLHHPDARPRLQLLRNLHLALPHLALNHARYRSDGHPEAEDTVAASMGLLAAEGSDLRSVRIIMDKNLLNWDNHRHSATHPHAYASQYLSHVLKFHGLAEFSVSCSGHMISTLSSLAHDRCLHYLCAGTLGNNSSNINADIRLLCGSERAIREIVTRNGDPVNYCASQTARLGKTLWHQGKNLRLAEFYTRLREDYTTWWMGLSAEERDNAFDTYENEDGLAQEAAAFNVFNKWIVPSWR